MARFLGCATIVAILWLSFACGGGGSTSSSSPTAASAGTNPPSAGRVVLVVEENHSYSEVIGNAAMPYLNALASQNAVATQYYADAHPSISDYLMLTTGQMETMDNGFTGSISDDNVVRELVKANKSWHCYAESLPSVGYLGGDVLPYIKHHNPFAYLSDVIGSSQASNIVPFGQFASDLSSGSLPDFSFVVPNINDDAHDGTLAGADQWLQANVDPLIKSSSFQSNGLLIITFDEGNESDSANGGGHVATVIVGPMVKKGFQSSTMYQHQSTLRLVLSTLGVHSYPGAAGNAPSMGEFFQ